MTKPSPTPTDEDLAALAREGDSGAFEQIVVRHCRALFALFLRSTGRSADNLAHSGMSRHHAARYRAPDGQLTATTVLSVDVEGTLCGGLFGSSASKRRLCLQEIPFRAYSLTLKLLLAGVVRLRYLYIRAGSRGLGSGFAESDAAYYRERLTGSNAFSNLGHYSCELTRDDSGHVRLSVGLQLDLRRDLYASLCRRPLDRRETYPHSFDGIGTDMY
ncbi:MAG: hypothetical protein CME06_14470 [Gemmatimonadetes bacterium]|nr:hypothetical protein [Gemmatimonadota bacterium]